MKRHRIAFAALLITALTLAFAQPPAELTPDLKKDTVENLVKAMNQNYVFEDQAKKVADTLTKNLKSGAYDSVKDGSEFARLLSDHMNALCKDAHLRVQYSPQALPERKAPNEPSAKERDLQKESMKFGNAGFRRVERLEGNVGLIEFVGFQDHEVAARPIKAAMEFLADTDALIFDIRQNGGGSPETVRLLCSYLFGDKPVHLNTLHWRGGQKEEFWTFAKVAGPKYLDKDVYVLTSKRTGSAAEEFAYNLQNQKRATIVGEVTWGGANPGGMVRLNDHFSAFIPRGYAQNPITKTNWEGVGVKPDVAVDPQQGLRQALTIAIKKLMDKPKGPEHKRALEQALTVAEKR